MAASSLAVEDKACSAKLPTDVVGAETGQPPHSGERHRNANLPARCYSRLQYGGQRIAMLDVRLDQTNRHVLSDFESLGDRSSLCDETRQLFPCSKEAAF